MKTFFAILFLTSLSLQTLLGAPKPAAIEDNPFLLAEKIASIPTSEPLHDYYVGIIAASFRHTEEADTAFNRFLAQKTADTEHEHNAIDTLAGCYLRDGRYAKAAELFQIALDRYGSTLDADELLSAKQNLGVAQALSSAPAQEVLKIEASQLVISRDKMKLSNVAVRINGTDDTAIWDTGANFSTINESVAKARKMRFLPGAIEVSTSTGQPTSGHMAIAENLSIGNCHLKNVAFVVLPDAALDFPQMNYSIRVIIGLPVIEALGCIRFHSKTSMELGLPRVRPAKPELALSGLSPMIRAEYQGETLPFFLDSGARNSSLRLLFTEKFPSALKDASKQKHKRGGAGGIVEVTENVIPKLRIMIGDVAADLKDANVNEEQDSSDAAFYGTIGSDILFAGKGYEIDLQGMHFQLLK